MKRVLLTIVIMASIALLAFMVPSSHLTIFMAGDSTMAIKDPRAYPETGWGMPFRYMFDSTVTVTNLAKNGASTKSFIAEGLWQKIYDGLKPGDYVLIQFGHNDEIPTKATATTPEVFHSNLVRFINDTRAKQGIPVLITPVARRKFNDKGMVEGTHDAYSTIVREVASAEHIVLIDLDRDSQALLQKLGPENSKFLYNHLEPGEHPNYPKGRMDNTHFSELGARKVAELVLNQIRSQNLGLAAHIINGQK